MSTVDSSVIQVIQLILPVAGTLIGTLSGGGLAYVAQSRIADKTYRRANADRRKQRMREAYEGLAAVAERLYDLTSQSELTIEGIHDCMSSIKVLVNAALTHNARLLTDDTAATVNLVAYYKIQSSMMKYLGHCSMSLANPDYVDLRETTRTEVRENYWAFLAAI